MNQHHTIPHTRSQLTRDFAALGVTPGQTIMLHSSIKAVGPVLGGPNTIVQALLDALGPDGTLMMYAGWHDIPDFVLDLPPDERQVYYAEHPAFDPRLARAVRDNSYLAEVVRTWPGAERSLNPEASMVALGALAEPLTRDHPLNYGYGPGSPLAKLVEWRGRVLLLGAPLDNITLLHYAENRARMRHKNIIHYQCPILRDGQTVWVDIEDYETGETHADYSFEQIAQAYLAQHATPQGRVGDAPSFLFDAAALTVFAIDWLEAHFG
jgi:aminoglycoside 3-N-acetyltransferase